MNKKRETVTPLVSVIITCYNGERFVREAIESVINQSWRDWELIVVDDGSIDNSKEIIRHYITSRRVTLIEHSCNKGIPKTKNSGIKKAKGKYIAFLDQDDIWMRSKLELQVSHFKESEDIGIVCSGMLFTNRNMKRRRIFKGFDDSSQRKLLKSLYLCPINSSSIMMIKKEVFSRVGFFDENLIGWDDYEMLMRIATQFQVRYLRKPLVKKRIYQDSTQGTRMVRDEIKGVFDRILVLHPFLKKYKNINNAMIFYGDSIRLIEQGKKVLARKRLRKSIEMDSHLFKAKFLYILSFLPGQFSLRIKSIISSAINLIKLWFDRSLKYIESGNTSLMTKGKN